MAKKRIPAKKNTGTPTGKKGIKKITTTKARPKKATAVTPKKNTSETGSKVPSVATTRNQAIILKNQEDLKKSLGIILQNQHEIKRNQLVIIRNQTRGNISATQAQAIIKGQQEILAALRKK